MGQYVDDLMREYEVFMQDKDANEFIYRRATDDRIHGQLEEANTLLSVIAFTLIVYGIVKIGLGISKHKRSKKSEEKN